MNPEGSHTHRVKTKQRPDGTWVAWVVGLMMVVYALTETKAINMVEKILGDKEKNQDEE